MDCFFFLHQSVRFFTENFFKIDLKRAVSLSEVPCFEVVPGVGF